MEVEIIGANSAFAAEGLNSSLFIRHLDQFIVADCGYNIYPRLKELGFTSTINAVLLSHLHQDHCGSAVTLLEDILLNQKRQVYIGGTDWQPLLKACEESGFADLLMTENLPFELETIKVPHGKGMDCRALFINRRLLYSGDSAISLLDTPQAAAAALIVHDAGMKSGIPHAYIQDLAKARPEIKAKTLLIHYLPQNYRQLAAMAKDYGFKGVARAGDIYSLA